MLCAVLGSTACVVCPRFSVFGLSSVKDRADTDPQSKYHPAASPKVFSLVLFCCWGFGLYVHESKVPRLLKLGEISELKYLILVRLHNLRIGTKFRFY